MRRLNSVLSSSVLAGICLAHMTPVVAVPVGDHPTVMVQYGGSTYVISSLYTTFNDGITELQSQPWWGNASLANNLSGLIGTTAGSYDGYTNSGLLFAYGGSVGPGFSVAYYIGNQVQTCAPNCGPSNVNFYWAVLNQLVTLDTIGASLQSTSTGVNAINNNLNMMINGAHSRPLARLVAPGQKTLWVAGDWGVTTMATAPAIPAWPSLAWAITWALRSSTSPLARPGPSRTWSTTVK